MPEYRVLAKQTESCERRRVGHAVAFQDVAMLPVVLRAMGLYQVPGLFCEGPERFEEFVGARRNEARRDDRAYEAQWIIERVDGIYRCSARGKRRLRAFVSVVVGVPSG